MIPLIRARARGLSFTSTNCALPDSRTARAVASSDSGFAPSGGSSCTETTNSPSSSSRCSCVGSLGRRHAAPRLALAEEQRAGGLDGSSSTAARIAAICAGVVPQQPPMIARAERARLRRELAEVRGRRVREHDALPRHAREADVRQRRERRAARRASRRARRAPPRARRRGSRRTRRRRARASRAAAARAETPPSVCRRCRSVMSATIGSAETERTRRDRASRDRRGRRTSRP